MYIACHRNAAQQAEEYNATIRSVGIKHECRTDKEKNDPRLPLQRDRDRIVWSKSFKRLAHKTQVFPHIYSDHQRQRMSHSLEVMQLASSMARTFGLNSILCEAIALAHDLGHTPFGHAGENAIDEAMQKINIVNVERYVRGLSRFSHYEQGLDVVTYMDSIAPDNEAAGLHLSPFIKEGILKHAYYHTHPEKEYKSLPFLLEETKYKEIEDNSGSLESQVVRICDKISYFISDIEDGLIIGALHLEELKRFGLILPVFEETNGYIANMEDDYRRFRSKRDQILSNIVESVLKKGYFAKGNGTLEIEPEEDVKKEMEEIYSVVEKTLFQDNILVKRANKRAKHIVSCLLCQYLRHPELITWRFRRRYIATEQNDYIKKLREIYLIRNDEEGFEKKTSIELGNWQHEKQKKEEANCQAEEVVKDRTFADILCVKDYVAGFTDNYAEERYKSDVDCRGSRETWRLEDLERPAYFETVAVKKV